MYTGHIRECSVVLEVVAHQYFVDLLKAMPFRSLMRSMGTHTQKGITWLMAFTLHGKHL
jgi:hypothetical protein